MRNLLLVIVFFLLASSAECAMVEVSCVVTTTTAVEVASGAPDGIIINLFATTDADILSIGKVDIQSSFPLYNVAPPFGSDTAPPALPFIALVPNLTADSWITTPGNTSLLGPGLEELDGTSTFGDLSDDGPQSMFQFARFTFPADTAVFFSGVVTVRGSTGPESFAFNASVCIPEPGSLAISAIAMSSCFLLARKRPTLLT